MAQGNSQIDRPTADHRKSPRMLDLSWGFLLANNVALGCVFALGFIGNLLVLIVVLTQKAAHTVINIYLINLAVADILHLLSVPPLIHLTLVGSWPWGSGACTMYYILYYTNWTVSIFIIVAMGFDRYKAVVSPFTSQRYRSRGFAISLLVALWFLGAMAMLPIGLCAHVHHMGSDELNATDVKFCVHSSFDENGTLAAASPLRRFFLDAEHSSWYMFAVGCLLPTVLLAGFYGLILRKLHRLRLARAASGGGGGGGAAARFERVTMLVTAVVAFYLGCSLPHWIHVIFTLSVDEPATWMAHSSHLTTLLSYVGSAGNPVLYAFLNDSFRTGLGGLLAQAGCSDADAAAAGGSAAGVGGRRGREALTMRPAPARERVADVAGGVAAAAGGRDAEELLSGAAATEAPVGTSTYCDGYLSDGLGICSGQVLETAID